MPTKPATPASTPPATPHAPTPTKRRTRPRQAEACFTPRADIPRTANGDRIHRADPTAVGGIFRGRAGKDAGRTVVVVGLTPDGRYLTRSDKRTVATGPNTLHRRYSRVGTDLDTLASAATEARAALAAAEAAITAARMVGKAATRKAERRAIPAMDAVVAMLPDPTVPRSDRGRPISRRQPAPSDRYP